MMHAYWPTMLDNPEATAHERNHAAQIEQVDKVVCSRSLKKADWHNKQLITENLIEEVEALKAQKGQDIVVLGSPRLARFLLKEKLVDELKLSVSPVTLGEGLHLFRNIQSNLILGQSITMSHGALGLTYKVS